MKITLCNTIVIVNVYSGSYGEKNRNIGHEVFNIIPADDNKFYAYINPHGDLNKEKIPTPYFSLIFINGKNSEKNVEVIGCYPKCQLFVISKEKDNLDLMPKYFGRSLDGYFKDNVETKADGQQTNFVSVKSDECYFPINKMLIPNVSIHYGKLNNQSQKYYVKSNEVEYFDNLFSNREFSLKPNNLSETVIEMLNKVANKFNINSEKLELIYKNNGGAH